MKARGRFGKEMMKLPVKGRFCCDSGTGRGAEVVCRGGRVPFRLLAACGATVARSLWANQAGWTRCLEQGSVQSFNSDNPDFLWLRQPRFPRLAGKHWKRSGFSMFSPLLPRCPPRHLPRSGEIPVDRFEEGPILEAATDLFVSQMSG